MIKFLLLFLLPLSLFASKILSYNIYDRTDRADLMLTFDTPYQGTIKESRSKSKIIITLDNASIESQKIKKLSSPFLKSIVILPVKNATQIIATVTSSVKLIASKTADAYGLRLRFTKKTAVTKTTQNTTATQVTNTFALPTKKTDDLTRSYYIVIAIMIIGIFILFYIKKRMTPATLQQQQKRGTKQQKTPWLFNTSSKNSPQTPHQPTDTQQNSNSVTIRFQKAIDAHNSVVMLDFGAESYLVLMGNSNILLDKFHENRPSSQKEFESILQNRHEELENFLNNQTERPNNVSQAKEPLQAYKERAASLIYNDEL